MGKTNIMLLSFHPAPKDHFHIHRIHQIQTVCRSRIPYLFTHPTSRQKMPRHVGSPHSAVQAFERAISALILLSLPLLLLGAKSFFLGPSPYSIPIYKPKAYIYRTLRNVLERGKVPLSTLGRITVCGIVLIQAHL